MDNPNDLILLLARHLAAGKIESRDVVPVIRELLGEQTTLPSGARPPLEELSRTALLTALDNLDFPAARQLKAKLREGLPPLPSSVSVGSEQRLPPVLPEWLLRIPPVIPVEGITTPPVGEVALERVGRMVEAIPPVEPKPVEPPAVEESEASKAWHEHVQPLLAGNWYMVVGIVSLVLGASVVAYYTWDKHWAFRYAITPSLLAMLTWLLAFTGSWLEARSPTLKGTGAMLRGAAIALLPINFMTVALLSRDPEVTQPWLFGPLMAVIYFLFFGWQLKRWCEEVHPSLGFLQGMSLLALNFLVALGPLALLVTHQPNDLRFLLGVGFHLGFFGLMASVWFFARRVLTPELVFERRVPWFFVATMGITFLQVFGLVHWSMRFLPQASTYAPLVILSGSLALFLERRVMELRPEKARYGGESFLGFALVLLGLLFGFRLPDLRILCFALAGAVWLYQASLRPGAGHYWIGLTLLMLGGASVGLLDQFPKSRDTNGLPALGIALALLFGLIRIMAGRLREERFVLAATDFQPMVLFLTAVVSVLSQWHYHSNPRATAAALLVVSAYFGWCAYRVQRVGWIHTAMALLALALPYLGCADMEGRNLHGNTMAFGLGLLSGCWLVAIRLRPAPLLLQARSTVVWAYGALAVSAMLVRVMIDRETPGDSIWGQALMDYAGPYLMTAALLVTAYHSRSMVPSVMAAIIFAVLFPELKAKFKEWYPLISWGTGLGSACSAFALTLLCFPLKRWTVLQNLGEGDLFMGKTPFPGQRRNHTLFTIPFMGAAIFLAARVDTWTLAHQLSPEGVVLKTAIALAVTGMVWTLLAVHLRGENFGKLVFHFGWIAFFLAFYYGDRHFYEHPQLQVAILSTGLVLQAFYLLYRLLVDRQAWVAGTLLHPTAAVLRRGSLLLSWGTLVYLINEGELARVQWLGAFLLLQLVWHAVATDRARYGFAFFVLALTGLLAWCAPGQDFLLSRLTIYNALEPILWMALVVQAAQIVLEFSPHGYSKLRALMVPSQIGTVFLVLLGAWVGVQQMLWAPVISLNATHQALLIASLALTARANRSGEFALAAIALGYFFLYTGELARHSNPEARILFLLTPWRASALGLCMAVAGYLGQLIHSRVPELLAGAHRLGKSHFSPLGWIFLPAAALALQAALYHTINPELRMEPIQLWAPYLGAITLALISWSWQDHPWERWAWRREIFLIMAGAVLSAANVHAVNVFIGATFHQKGLSDIHVVCLGLVFTLLQGTLIRWLSKGETLRRRLNQGSTFLAGLVLVLLAFNYFVHPNLASIGWRRFMLSGMLSLAAAFYFRYAARHPGLGEKELRDWHEGFYHFGVSLFIWCVILLVPEFRYPSTVLLALGVPVVYFYLRTEFGLRSARESLQITASGYRNSAAALGFLLLALYVFRAAFQMILFPGDEILTDHYHYNAPIMLLLAFLLIRLRGLGGTWWLAFYGGLALIAGAYFSATSWPGFSPFDHPVPAAWAAVVMTHLFMVGSYQRSPLRSVIQAFGGIEGSEWLVLCKYWGRCMLAVSQIVILLGIFRHGRDSYEVAPLLAAAATIFIHQGIVGKIRWYFVAAAIQWAVALHADFILPSYIPADDVIWVILGLWGAIVFGYPLWKRWVTPDQLGPTVALLFAGCAAHVYYHHAYSWTGLWAVTAMTVLGALTPRQTKNPATAEQMFAAGLMLLAIPWLVYFSQARFLELERTAGPFNAWPGDWPLVLMFHAAVEAWPVLTTLMALFLTGIAAGLYQKKCASYLQQIATPQPRIYHQTLSLVEQFGNQIHGVLLWIAFLFTSATVMFHYGSAFATREIVLCSFLWIGYSLAWFREGSDRGGLLPGILGQLSVFALFITIRRHLILTTTFWNYEYDVWTSLAVSCCLTAAKQIIDQQRREVRLSLMGPLFVLPVVGLVWTFIHHLGADISLTVVGLHSLMFAFLGKDERQSPCNMVAITGFVLFVVILFWAKFELRVWHAYVIPVGLGILVLLQIFGRDMEKESRNRVRFVTLMAMLASTSYYALVDGRHPLTFNLTLLLICLGAMAVGSLLRVRVFLALGFAGMLLALSSIVYKVMVHQDRTIQMTSIGLLLLLLGVGLVTGSAYYKMHHEEFEEKLNRLRERLGNWD